MQPVPATHPKKNVPATAKKAAKPTPRPGRKLSRQEAIEYANKRFGKAFEKLAK